MALITKEKDIIQEVAAQIKDKLKGNLVHIKLFGSKVRGDYNKESGIDILIVVKEKDMALRDDIYNLLFQIDPYYEYKVSIILFSLYEFQKNEQMESTFIRNINETGINL